MLLGLAAVVLVLSQQQIVLHFGTGTEGAKRWGNWMNVPIILAPILMTLLLTLAQRFRSGQRWVLLRGCTETVRREIYGYRLGAGRYRQHRLKGMSADEYFRERITAFGRRLMQTEVNRHAVPPYEGDLDPKQHDPAKKDDGFSTLTPGRYVEIVIDGQVQYFSRAAQKLERNLRWLVILIVVSGAAGTFLAAVELKLWVALTTALATALTTHLKTWQTEETLMVYNQCATDLRHLSLWWASFPGSAKSEPAIIDQMLETAEEIFEAESAGWAQRMADALANLPQPPATPAGPAKPRGATGKKKK